MRRGWLALAALALCVASAGARQLQQAGLGNTTTVYVGGTATVTGKAVILARDFVGNNADKRLAVHWNGRMLPIPNADPSIIKQLSTGDIIQVQGEIIQEIVTPSASLTSSSVDTVTVVAPDDPGTTTVDDTTATDPGTDPTAGTDTTSTSYPPLLGSGNPAAASPPPPSGSTGGSTISTGGLLGSTGSPGSTTPTPTGGSGSSDDQCAGLTTFWAWWQCWWNSFANGNGKGGSTGFPGAGNPNLGNNAGGNGGGGGSGPSIPGSKHSVKGIRARKIKKLKKGKRPPVAEQVMRQNPATWDDGVYYGNGPLPTGPPDNNGRRLLEEGEGGDGMDGMEFVMADGSQISSGFRRRLQGVVRQQVPNPLYVSGNPLMQAEMRVLVIPITAAQNGVACPGTTLPNVTRLDIRRAMFVEAAPLQNTVASNYARCSLNQTFIREASPFISNLANLNGSYVAPNVVLPCNGTNDDGIPWTFSKCDFDDFNGYADAADAAMAARGVNLTSFKYKVYLVPPGPCMFVGLAFIGCDDTFPCRAWIGGNYWRSDQAIAHELGHNLYLGHAGAYRSDGTFDEYADDSCMMGYCCVDRCPNAPHTWQLGWQQALFLNGTNLPAGVTLNVTVPASAFFSRASIRIMPTWAATVDPFFLSFRTKNGGDTDLDTTLVNKIHIHQSSSTGSYDADVSTWRGALAVNQAWSHPTAQIVIRRGYSSTGSTALVSICRRGGAETLATCLQNIDFDCNGKAGVDDPACAIYL